MQNPDISFIQLKLANIGTALFYCGDGCQLPFTTYIITALKVDQDGFVWFFINKGNQEHPAHIKPFAAHLEFFKKGYPFFMGIKGQASIESVKEKMDDLMGKGIQLSEEALAGILLVKVKIEKVDYKELKQQKALPSWQQLTGWCKHLLHPAAPQWQVNPAIS
ncbi:MAG TPA: hypothetical protein VL307_03265 [Chitinophagaceae bacterium]|nr:hypothetical protein [Chitinophagaceae bacterium]